MAITKTWSCAQGTPGQRFVIWCGGNRYNYVVRDKFRPRFDVERGCVDADDIPEHIRKECRRTRYLAKGHEGVEWPFEG